MALPSRLLKRLWSETDGFIVSAELVLIATILVLALVVGLSDVRTAIAGELTDVAKAFSCVNQTYHSHGHGYRDRNGSNDFTPKLLGHE